MTKTTKNKNHRGSASQFFVAGELCRRGYVAVVTMGNTPNTDILCSNEEGTKFVYKAFNITKETPFNGEEEYADFVIWDGLYDAEVAYGVITND